MYRLTEVELRSGDNTNADKGSYFLIGKYKATPENVKILISKLFPDENEGPNATNILSISSTEFLDDYTTMDTLKSILGDFNLDTLGDNKFLVNAGYSFCKFEFGEGIMTEDDGSPLIV